MARQSLSLVCGLAPVLLLAAVLQDRPQPGQDKAPVPEAAPAEGRIAVVDIRRVVTSTPDFEKANEDLKKQQEELRDNLEGLKTKLRDLRTRMDLLNPGPELDKLVLDYQIQKNALPVYEKLYNDFMLQEELKAPLPIYEKVDKAIAELAKRRKIQLVIRSTSLGKSGSLREKQDYNLFRPVLYSAPELDITEDVIKYLKAQ